MTRLRRTLLTALAVSTLLALPSFGQQRQGEICIGRFCGLERGFEARHCHLRPGGDPAGDDYCWSSLPADFACEELGYTVNAICPEPAALTGPVGQQLLTLAGYGQFRSQIVRPATARMAARDLMAAAAAAGEAADGDGDDEDGEEADDAAEDGEEDGADRYRIPLSEITTALEYESWELGGLDGETTGIRFDWLRETETGILLGAAASYQDASPDGGDSTGLLNGQLSVGHTLGAGATAWSWGAFGTVSDVSGPVDDTLVGGGARLAFARYFAGGQVLSGGILGQYQTSDELEDDLINFGAGAAYGFPLGERFALDFELYAVNVIEPEIDDDTFFTGGGMFSVYFSPRFTLTLGARVLEGIDELDSLTYSLGSSTRF
ncbi:MAG TPA: hypothetical protein VMR44_02865 [Thermoanaerobaculia bacterium]|nr:hypothetical protein [Thermoanaerobaculia bacterium]